MGEAVVKVRHHVQETQRDSMDHLPGRPPAPAPGLVGTLESVNRHLIKGEDVLVPGVSSRQVLHGVEMTTGTQNFGHMGTEILQNAGETGGIKMEH